jgi:hypothetical protein
MNRRLQPQLPPLSWVCFVDLPMVTIFFHFSFYKLCVSKVAFNSIHDVVKVQRTGTCSKKMEIFGHEAFFREQLMAHVTISINFLIGDSYRSVILLS